MTITVNGEEIDNEDSAEWEDGDNELVVVVSRKEHTTTYTVTVTKTEASE